jgi:hypothetical protein
MMNAKDLPAQHYDDFSMVFIIGAPYASQAAPKATRCLNNLNWNRVLTPADMMLFFKTQ